MSCQKKECVATAKAYDDFRVNSKRIKRDNDKDYLEMKNRIAELETLAYNPKGFLYSDCLEQADAKIAELESAKVTTVVEAYRLRGKALNYAISRMSSTQNEVGQFEYLEKLCKKAEKAFLSHQEQTQGEAIDNGKVKG